MAVEKQCLTNVRKKSQIIWEAIQAFLKWKILEKDTSTASHVDMIHEPSANFVETSCVD